MFLHSVTGSELREQLALRRARLHNRRRSAIKDFAVYFGATLGPLLLLVVALELGWIG